MGVSINQYGTVKCPVCGKIIEWSYKLVCWIPNEANRLATTVESVPEAITHFATEEGKVCFRIGCKKCGSTIETNSMPLLSRDKEESTVIHEK